MATIAVLAHEHDRFHSGHYMLQHHIPHWIDAGHIVVLHEGLSEPPPADIAILHVDLTVVPKEYIELTRRYPVVVNGATAPLGKRATSEHLVAQGDGYAGPVIVKTDANSGGLPELHWSRMEAKKGRPPPTPVRYIEDRYPIFASPATVPAEVWSDPQLVVEKFLPERDQRGFALRVYLFLGDSERCSRSVGRHPVVKGADVIERTPCAIPDEVREHRRRLRLDYGKIDFVIHRGQPIVLDANRTPTMPGGDLGVAVQAGMRDLAKGIGAFCR